MAPGGNALQALELGVKKEMDRIEFAVKQRWTAAKKSLGKKKPLTLSRFAREVSYQLHYEIKALSTKKETISPLLLLPQKLAGFQKHLLACGDAINSIDTSNIIIALDLLERLCKVSYIILHTALPMLLPIVSSYALIPEAPSPTTFNGLSQSVYLAV